MKVNPRLSRNREGRVLLTGCALTIISYAIVALVALIAAFIASSCTASRKTEKTVVATQQVQRHETEQATSVSTEQTFKSWAQDHWRDIDMRILLYDTSRPPDSMGAYPPLMADIDIHSHEAATTTAIDSARHEVTTASSAESSEAIESTINEHSKSETQAGTPLKAMELLAAISAIAFAITVWMGIRDKIPKTR